MKGRKRLPAQLKGFGVRAVNFKPPKPCVYFLCDGDEVVYVGQSVNLLGRLADHAKQKRFDRVFMIPCERHQLDDIESEYIFKLKPRYNFSPSNGKLYAPSAKAGVMVA